jgi:exopolysaccharide production protein ExoZ
MLVVLMHITVTFSDTFSVSFLGNFFKFGGSGVDIFFVLSGFIITWSNRQYIANPSAIGKFLKKRLIRIFPIYWIIISFFLLLQVLLPSFYRTHFVFTIPDILNTYLLLPNHKMVNGVSWSLTNEIFFYFLFTTAILLSQKKYSLLLLLLFFTVLMLPPAIPFLTINKNNFIDLLFFPMNIEFILGITVVLLLDKFPQKWSIPLLGTGILLFIFSAFLFNKGIFFFSNGYNRVLMFGIPSFIIILALVKYELAVNIKPVKLLLSLGDASYSIYLFHLPVVAAFFKIITNISVTSHLLLVLLSMMLLSAICFAGIIIYKKIEKPMIKWLNINLF